MKLVVDTDQQVSRTPDTAPWQQPSRSSTIIPVLVILLTDVLMLGLAFGLSIVLVDLPQVSGGAPSIVSLAWMWGLIAAATIAALASAGLSSASFVDAPTRLTLRGLGIISFIAIVSAAIASLVSPEMVLYAIYAWVAIVPLFVIGRGACTLLLRLLSALGVGTRGVLVVGSSHGVAYATQKLASHGVWRRFAGSIDLGNQDGVPEETQIEQITEAIERVRPWEILIAAPPAHMARIQEAIEPLVPRSTAVRFAIYPLLHQPQAQGFDKLPGDLFTLRVRSDTPGSRYIVAKRILDIPMATIAVLLTAPLMLAIALAVKIDSPGPVLFRQTRVGRDGRTFTMYKFRSMHANAEDMRAELETLNEADGPLFKLRKDPRITRVGRTLRRFSLDELPQFFNVLEGNMGVVGPRPALPSEVAEYEPWQLRRLAVLPGITGLWQVNRQQCSSFEEMVWLDIEYVEQWSPALDLAIVAKTVPAMIAARGAY